MNIKILFGVIFSLAVMTVFGCGGGGGGATPPTIISGVASKGPFISGSPVKVFAVDQATGTKGAQLGTGVVSDGLGTYSVDIGIYAGPIVIEVSGTYKDEANPAQPGQVDVTTPLRAVISNAVSGTNVVMVTPLTELAVREMNNTYVKANIDAKNAEIATIFKLDNIITTKPVDATDATAIAAATTAQKNYSLVLAAVSQLVTNSATNLDTTLTGMSTDISGNVMADRSIAGFKTALFDFVTSANNKTGITDTATATVNIGSFKLAHLKISTAGLAADAKIGGIDFTFNLPAGVTLPKDALTNEVSPGSVVISGVAAAVGTTNVSLATLNQQALRTMVANAQGFGGGEFVDISCTIPAGNTAVAADFTTAIAAATHTITDLTGLPIQSVALTATVDIF